MPTATVSAPQEYMANLLQIKIGTLSGYERGYRTPDLEMTKKIATLLGVSVDYLLGLDKKNTTPWWEKDIPPTDIELEKFIRAQPNLRIFGDPLDEEVKDDVMLALRAAWEALKKERTASKQPKGSKLAYVIIQRS
jgi:transcriptional regulator with XRE-family HTH domain